MAFIPTPPLVGTPSVQMHHSCKQSLPRAESKLFLQRITGVVIPDDDPTLEHH